MSDQTHDQAQVDAPAGPATLGEADYATIARVFGVSPSEIGDVEALTEGMTNTNFVFRVGDAAYVYRRPGAGTDALIDRHQEQRNYELVDSLQWADELRYFDGDSGVKISTYYAGARVSDPASETDLRQVMAVLSTIHQARIEPPHRFDIEERIGYYESLATEAGGINLPDYQQVRAEVDELLDFRRALAIPEFLSHIDYVFANLLHLPDGRIKVIDWEYAGAADPLIDIAMYAIYAYYARPQMDHALELYLGREPTRQETARLYLYVALAGFLWSLWTEYKEDLGDDFGTYGADMYRYMTEYYQVLRSEGYLTA